MKTDPLAAVASSDHRNAGGPEDLVRSLPVESLLRAVVEFINHGLDVLDGVDGQVGLLWKVLPQ